MSGLRALGRAVLAALTAVLVLCLGYCLVQLSWGHAPKDGKRLRWVVVAKETIPAGEQIQARMIESRFRRLPWDTSKIITQQDVLNQFARHEISASQEISVDAVGPALWSVSVVSDVLVPVDIVAGAAQGLRPGMRVAFMRAVEREKSPELQTAGIPPCAASGRPPPVAKTEPLGFPVVSKTESGGDKPKVVILVQIPDTQSGAILALASGEWRPINLASVSRASPLCVPLESKPVNVVK